MQRKAPGGGYVFTYLEDLETNRGYDTEVRVCRCKVQDCKGRFLIKKTSSHKICPGEYIRRYKIKTIKKYYE